MTNFFVNRRYPSQLVTNAHNKIKGKSQSEILLSTTSNTSDKKNNIPLITNFHPQVKNIFPMILNNWNILQKDISTSSLFQKHPLLTFRKGKNLSDMLVSSKMDSEPTLSGTYPCNRTRCLTCEHTSSQDIICAPKCSFHIKNSFTCTSY